MVPFKDCSNLSTILWIINENQRLNKVFFLNADVIKLVNQDLE